MRTLMVDDDYITSQIMLEILKAFGTCDLAVSGSDALKLFEKSQAENNHYDVIFLDIMMPEMDGQEVLNRIRRMENENGVFGLDCTKIIMTTALDDYENIRSAFKNQAEGYLVKPISKDKVINILNNFDLLD